MTNSTNNTYTVYRIITPTGEQYIGSTSNFTNRIAQHTSASKYGSHLPVHKAIRRHGISNVRFLTIETNLTKTEAALLERVLIRELSTLAPNGLNATTGGEGCEFGGLHTGKGYDFNKQKQKYEVGRRLNGKHLYFKAFIQEQDAIIYSGYLKTLSIEQLLAEHKATKVRKPRVISIKRATISSGLGVMEILMSNENNEKQAFSHLKEQALMNCEIISSSSYTSKHDQKENTPF